jgi:glutathione-regulated potassium-efflux system ancillary protein KefG
MNTRVLVLFCHPAFHKSRINRRLVESIRGLEGVRFHDLYEEYPDFDIDIQREQALLVAHEVIVLQHPFFWYSSPALLKEWEDLVLEYGFAYGPGGTALAGKTLLTAITTGGGAHAYSREGHNYFTIRELLAPFEQTARLCGMRYAAPFVVHGAIQLTTPAEIDEHGIRYRRRLEALRDGRDDETDVLDADESVS